MLNTLIQLIQYTQQCTPNTTDLIDDFNDNNNIEQFIQNNILTIPCGVTQIKQQIQNYINKQQIIQVVIPDSVQQINESAFYYCTGLQQVTLPDSITTIGNFAFSGCASLTSVQLPSQLTTLQQQVFDGCTELQTITFPDVLNKIELGALLNCKSLKTADFSSTQLKIIEKLAFQNCSELTTVTLPEIVTDINENVFSDCSKLESINLPDSLTNIGFGAFSDCQSLTSIKIPDSVTIIQNNTFSGCKALTSIQLSPYTTSIGNNAFQSCESLVKIVLPNSITTIGQYAFSNNYNLQDINIPTSLTAIQQYTFSYCRQLSSLNIPKTVSEIQNYIIYQSWLVSCISIQGNPSIDNQAFAYSYYQNFTDKSQFDKGTCPSTLFSTCLGNSNEFKYILNETQVCVEQKYVKYYTQNDSDNYFVPGCQMGYEYYQNEARPYQCVTVCQGEYAQQSDTKQCSSSCSFYVDSFKYKICTDDDNKCNSESQMISQYNQNRIQCVNKCSESANTQLIYVLNNKCKASCGSRDGQNIVWSLNDKNDKQCRNETYCNVIQSPPEYIDSTSQCIQCYQTYTYLNENQCSQSCIQFSKSIQYGTRVCVTDCGQNVWYYTDSEQQCTDQENCLNIDQHTLQIENTNQCVGSCEGLVQQYVYQQYCVSSCITTEYKYLQYNSNVCTDQCENKNTWSYINDQQQCSNQQQCQQNYYIIKDNNNQCVSSCPYNQTYQFIQDNECVKKCTNEYAQQQNSTCNSTCNFIIQNQEDLNSKQCIQDNECQEGQLKAEFSSNRYQCLTDCQQSINQYYYQQEQQCVQTCTEDYAKPQNESKICNNTCTFYVQDNSEQKYCTVDDKCQENQYIFRIQERSQCVQNCPDKYKLKNNECAKEETNIGLIIGICVAVVIVIVIVIVVCCLIHKRKNNTNPDTVHMRNNDVQNKA